MSTFVRSLIDSLDTRWRDVDVLLLHAKQHEASNVELHDVLCRSAVVLTSAHLEGFMRDAARAIVDDLNRFSSFDKLPTAPKRTFCRMFIPEEGKEANERTLRMIQLLDGLKAPLNWECFLFDGSNDNHKNPSPSIIERISRNFGAKNVFGLLANSQLDEVFSGTSSEIDKLLSRLAEHITVAAASFPYSVNADEFKLHEVGSVARGQRSLWESFVDNLMRQRHAIAHGSVAYTVDAIDVLALTRKLVTILELGILIVICNAVVDEARQ